MYQCAYCNELNKILPIHKHGKYYHMQCYISKVHDDMIRIQAHLNSIESLIKQNIPADSIQYFIDEIDSIVGEY